MENTPQQKTQRPEFRNIHVSDLKQYRLPMAGKVSILHRVSGLALFLALPLMMALIAGMFRSQESFENMTDILSNPLVKILLIGFAWALMHHAVAGVRYLLLDLHIGIDKQSSDKSAKIVLITGLVLTLMVALRIIAA